MERSTLTTRTLRFGDGERLPLLIGDDQQPLYYPTLFITSQVRNAGRAASSIASQLASIKRLYVWAAIRHIDLEGRLADGQYLRDPELEDLSQFVCERLTSAGGSRRSRCATSRDAKLQDARIRALARYRHVMFIARYLQWLCERLAEARPGSLTQGLRTDIAVMVKSFELRKPRKSLGSRLAAKMGLTKEDQERLLNVTGASTAVDPAQSAVVQRDALIVRTLLSLGLRAGELLSLKTDDFDFQANEVVIRRRPDDPEDPRSQQPTVKTCDRRLPVADDLMKLIYAYVLGPRRSTRASKRHRYLFVVHRRGPYEGEPLTAKGLAKAFDRLRQATGISDLTPHTLRRTANDRFSELMDDQHIPEAREQQLRSYAMGWRDGSGTAAAYTRRYVLRKAMEASKALQAKLGDQKHAKHR